MPQKFAKNDTDEDKFLAVWDAALEQTFTDLEAFFENADQSIELGSALWDAQVVDVWKIIEKNLFVKIFDDLIKSGYNCGVLDSYCRVIFALFGESTEIDIVVNAPLNLTINITAEYQNLAVMLTRQGDIMLTRQGDIVMFQTLLNDVSQSQLALLFRAITNAGTKITFNLN